jgi:hypothetical protein
MPPVLALSESFPEQEKRSIGSGVFPMAWLIKCQDIPCLRLLMSPVPPFPRPGHPGTQAAEPARRLYTVLVFEPDLHVPWATLVEAADDGEAVRMARSIHPLKRREVWDRHRLVADIG